MKRIIFVSFFILSLAILSCSFFYLENRAENNIKKYDINKDELPSLFIKNQIPDGFLV